MSLGTSRCTKCYGELDTGYRCMSCGHVQPPVRLTTSDRTDAICTGGEGWCPVHGLRCHNE